MADARQLSQQLRAFHHRLETLHQALAARAAPGEPPLEAVVEELRTALEEVRVAEDTLREQQETLAAAYYTIAAERQRYQDLFDCAPDGYLVTDPAGVITEANRAAGAFLGLDAARLVGKPLVVFVPKDTRPAFRTRLADTLAGRPPPQRWTLWLHPRRHAPLYAALSVALVHGAQGALQGLRWSLRDITEAQRTAAALQHRTDTLAQQVTDQTAALSQSQDALQAEIVQHQHTQTTVAQQKETLAQREKLASMGSLLANVAHELNNPLAVVMMQADLLQEAAGDSPLAVHGREITEAATQCVAIIQNFLALARQHPPQRTRVDLNAVVTTAMKLLAYPLRVDTIAVEHHLAADLPPLWADPHQLQQVVVNLLTNAHQAVRETTGVRQVTVRSWVDPAQQHVMLEVADTGPGIPPALHERIFEPFFTTKPPGVGTGLGLPLCLGIVEGHGGQLHVASTPGHGARFRIALPLLPLPDDGHVPTPPSTLALQPLTILLVDDEAGIVRALAQLLRRDGHTVETAANGRLALEKCQGQDFTLILSDLRMPELDGPGFYEALAHQQPHLCPRVVFLTGDTLSPGVQTFLDRIHAPRLHKPFTATMVRQVIARFSAHDPAR